MFKAYSLLSKKDGKISGAMSPVLFAMDMLKQMEIPPGSIKIARIVFDDEAIFQSSDGHHDHRVHTGYDTIAIRKDYANNKLYLVFVDLGVSGLPVIMFYESDEEDKPITTPIYEKDKTRFLKYLNTEELHKLADFLKTNESIFEIQEKV